MHGIKKFRGTPEAEKEWKETNMKQIKKYCAILSLCKEKRTKREFDHSALALTSDLLQVNGDCYTMWNFRRETLDFLLRTEPDLASVTKLLKNELNFTQQAISRNPKSYWCWNQRQWVTAELDKLSGYDWKHEIELCDLMLNADSRNFHCWDYRRHVSKHCSSSEEELAFTQKMIEKDFSNYSAWHQRSKLLPIINPDPESLKEALKQELELVQNAFYTRPEDQSAWFYHRWLVSQIPEEEVIEKEIAKCEEILQMLEEEEGSPASTKKWPTLTLIFLLEWKKKLTSDDDEKTSLTQRTTDLLKQLLEVDPDHVNYYNFMITKQSLS